MWLISGARQQKELLGDLMISQTDGRFDKSEWHWKDQMLGHNSSSRQFGDSVPKISLRWQMSSPIDANRNFLWSASFRWNTINISKIPTWVRNRIDVFQHRPNSIHTGILCFWIPSKDWILLGQYVEAEPIHIVTLMYAFDWTIDLVMFQHNLYTNSGIMVLMMTMMLVLMKTMLWVARVLIAFNLNQIVIRVNQVATTGDQDCRCKIRELATNNGISFPKIKYLCLLLFASLSSWQIWVFWALLSSAESA